MAFIDYDFTVSIGAQESVDIMSELGVAVNKGFGVGDTLIYLPLFIAGMIGLWVRKEWGLYILTGALAITAYWPIVHIFYLLYAEGAPGFAFTDYATYGIVLTCITVWALWGLWFLFKFRRDLIN